MDVGFPPPPVEDSVERLSAFLTQLEDLLRLIIDEPTGLFPSELETELKAAWDEVDNAGAFSAARAALTEVAGQLPEAGLAGAQLVVKIALFDLSAKRAVAAIKDLPADVKRFGIAKVAGLIAGALGCADIIIDSLPPVPGKEQLKEIKLVVEKGAEMASLAD